jgi:hypothetical protein
VFRTVVKARTSIVRPFANTLVFRTSAPINAKMLHPSLPLALPLGATSIAMIILKIPPSRGAHAVSVSPVLHRPLQCPRLRPVLFLVLCRVQNRVGLPVLSLVRRPVVRPVLLPVHLPVQTLAVYLVQVPVLLPVLSRAAARVPLPAQRLALLRAAVRAHCPRLYRARRRVVDPVRHLAPGPVLKIYSASTLTAKVVLMHSVFRTVVKARTSIVRPFANTLVFRTSAPINAKMQHPSLPLALRLGATSIAMNILKIPLSRGALAVFVSPFFHCPLQCPRLRQTPEWTSYQDPNAHNFPERACHQDPDCGAVKSPLKWTDNSSHLCTEQVPSVMANEFDAPRTYL